jgi:hypothetical protein
LSRHYLLHCAGSVVFLVIDQFLISRLSRLLYRWHITSSEVGRFQIGMLEGEMHWLYAALQVIGFVAISSLFILLLKASNKTS